MFDSEHINFNESIALDFRLENMKSATESAKCLMQKVYGVDSMDVIDLPAHFNDSWNSCRWTANGGTASAIAEKFHLNY